MKILKVDQRLAEIENVGSAKAAVSLLDKALLLLFNPQSFWRTENLDTIILHKDVHDSLAFSFIACVHYSS